MQNHLSAVDVADRLREAAFAHILNKRQPASADDLAVAVGLRVSAVDRTLPVLAKRGWLDLDQKGRITGAAGLSLTTGPHRLQLAGHDFRTWCAYDGLGIPAALETDAELETICAYCGSRIRITMKVGMPEPEQDERLWLATGDGTNLRDSFCSPTMLVCGSDHGEAWGRLQDGLGRLVALDEAARRGSAEWAGCATVARSLR